MPEVHDDSLAVTSHYLVVRLAALVERYPGGPAAFVREHAFTSNDVIGVLCSTHGMQFRDIEVRLDGLGLQGAYFESYFDGIGDDLPVDTAFEMAPWLVGRWTGVQFMVYGSTDTTSG